MYNLWFMFIAPPNDVWYSGVIIIVFLSGSCVNLLTSQALLSSCFFFSTQVQKKLRGIKPGNEAMNWCRGNAVEGCLL